jgi:hypothetical protein
VSFNQCQCFEDWLKLAELCRRHYTLPKEAEDRSQFCPESVMALYISLLRNGREILIQLILQHDSDPYRRTIIVQNLCTLCRRT